MCQFKQMWPQLLLLLAIVAGQASAEEPPKPIYAIISPQSIVPDKPFTLLIQSEESEKMEAECAIIHQDENKNVNTFVNLQKAVEMESFGQAQITFNMPKTLSNEGFWQLGCQLISSNKVAIERKRLIVANKQDKKTDLLLMQTDKGLYKKGDKVLFRVLLLDSETRPIGHQKINLHVKDPKNNRIKQWQEVELNEFGQFNDEFQLSQGAPLGDYTIVMEAGQNKRELNINVAEYVLPQFSVDVVTPKHALHSAGEFPIVVDAKYTHGKPLKGVASITVHLKGWPINVHTFFWPEIQPLTEWTIQKPINGKLEIMFNPFKHMRYLPGQLEDEKLTVKVVVEDELTHKNATGTAQLEFVRDNIVADIVSVNAGLRPGTTFYGYIKLTTKDNLPIHDSINQAEFGYRFLFRDDLKKELFYSEFNSMTAFIDHGLIPLTIDVPKNAKTMLIRLKYKEFHLSLPMVETSYKRSDNYVQFAPINRQNNVDKVLEVIHSESEEPRIHFRIESTKPIAHLSYLVVAQGEIVDYQRVAGSESTTVNDVSSSYKPSMKKGFSIIAYYIAMVTNYYDKLEPKWLSESVSFMPVVESLDTLTISANATTTSPGEGLTIKTAGKPLSFVAVVGIDQSMMLLKSPAYIDDKQLAEQKSQPDSYRYFYNNFDRNGLTFMPEREIENIKYDSNRKVEFSIKSMPDDESPLTRGGAVADIVDEDEYRESFEESSGRLRQDFPETWLWDAQVSDEAGLTKFETKMPDTITSWVINAFEVNQKTGLAFQRNPLQVTVFNPFFIKPNLPYSIVRGEIAAVQVLVYNYLGKNKHVDVTLYNELGEFMFVKPSQSNEEQQVETVQDQQTKRIAVAADSVATISFLIRAEQVGHIRLQLNARTSDKLANDKIEQLLLVKADGQTQFFNKAVMITLKPSESSFHESLEVKIPADAVRGSRLITVNAIGDILGTSISNMGNLLRVPYGCGEQNMAGMVPNIVALDYLKTISRSTPQLERRAMNNLENGYQRQLTYQHPDGGFSVFGYNTLYKTPYEASTWLTAFVVKSFVQAQKFVSIDSNALSKSIGFLLKCRDAEGHFVEKGYVYDKHMMGGVNHQTKKGVSPALDAYILIALHEAFQVGQISAELLKPTIQALEKEVDQFPQPDISNKERDYDFYSLSIISYALKLVNSPKADQSFDRLWSLRQINSDGHIFFDTPKREQTQVRRHDWYYYSYLYIPNSNSIEATAYVLMTLNLRDDTANGVRLLQWLVSKQNSNGGFASTQDTVVALNALSTFAGRHHQPDSKLQIKFETVDENNVNSEPALKGQFNIGRENSLILHQAELGERGFEDEIRALTHMNISATGHGMAVVQVNWQYNVVKPDDNKFFDLNTRTTLIRNGVYDVQVCAKYLKGIETNMAIVQLETPSGYGFSVESIETLRKTQEIQRVDIDKSETEASFYFYKLTDNETCITVTIERLQLIANLKPALVSVYDYYQNNQATRASYRIDEQVNSSQICEENSC